jgi:hypothetical protein
MSACQNFIAPITHHFRKTTVMSLGKTPVYRSHNIGHFLTPVLNSLEPLQGFPDRSFLQPDGEGDRHDTLIHGPNRLRDSFGALGKFPVIASLGNVAAFAKALQIVSRCLAAVHFCNDMVAVQSEGIVCRTAEPAGAADISVTGQNLRANRIRDLCLAHRHLPS